MSAIQLKNATRVFHSRSAPEGLVAYTDINFAVEPGQFLCLLGPSGCGKSSILNALAGLDGEFEGEITVLGSPVRGSSASTEGPSIGYVFQEPRLLPWLTVEKNIKFALQCAHVPSQDWHDRIHGWLERVGLRGFAHSYPHELSGGMQQRVAIARAFSIDSQVLLMDEPFSGLDEFTARAMREHLLELWESTRKTVVFVTHNTFEASFLADRILVMSPRPGRIEEDLDLGLSRPRDYEATELFEASVRVTRILTSRAPHLETPVADAS